MAVQRFVILFFLVSLSLLQFAQSHSSSSSSDDSKSGDDSLESKFSHKVSKHISDETYQAIFNVDDTKTPEQFQKIGRKAIKKFEKKLGVHIDADVQQQLDDVANDYANKLDSAQLFDVYTKSVAKTLIKKGVLNSDNVKKVAKKYAKELKKYAEKLKDDDVSNSLVALAKATAKVFKKEGLTSNEIINEQNQNLVDEFRNIDISSN